MIICSLCTGRHASSSCATGLRHIEDCLSGTVDDYVQPMAEVIPLPFIARHSAPFGGVEAAGERWHPSEGKRAIEHWHARFVSKEGIPGTKLA